MLKIDCDGRTKVSIDVCTFHRGATYEVLFNEKDEIVSFKPDGIWMS